jgi:hypothetical protein
MIRDALGLLAEAALRAVLLAALLTASYYSFAWIIRTDTERCLREGGTWDEGVELCRDK